MPKEALCSDASPQTPIARPDAGKDLGVAVAELLATTEYPQIARWIQFPTAVPLFLLVPNESGAVYVRDRRDEVWYWVDFEDQKYSGYNLAELDALLEQCYFLRLVENPRLLRDREWFVTAGRSPEPVGARLGGLGGPPLAAVTSVVLAARWLCRLTLPMRLDENHEQEYGESVKERRRIRYGHHPAARR